MHERSKHDDEEVLQKECAGFLVVLNMGGGVAQEEVLGDPKEVAGFGGCHQTAAFTILRAERPGSRGFSATHLLSLSETAGRDSLLLSALCLPLCVLCVFLPLS